MNVALVRHLSDDNIEGLWWDLNKCGENVKNSPLSPKIVMLCSTNVAQNLRNTKSILNFNYILQCTLSDQIEGGLYALDSSLCGASVLCYLSGNIP